MDVLLGVTFRLFIRFASVGPSRRGGGSVRVVGSVRVHSLQMGMCRSERTTTDEIQEGLQVWGNSEGSSTEEECSSSHLHLRDKAK